MSKSNFGLGSSCGSSSGSGSEQLPGARHGSNFSSSSSPSSAVRFQFCFWFRLQFCCEFCLRGTDCYGIREWGAQPSASQREQGHEVLKLLLLQCAARAKIYQAETLGAEICIASTSYHNSRAKDIQILRKSI